jgi:hypothetical protein
MGRKDVMHRTEGAVADLPAVKVRGIAVGGIAAGWVALRGAGHGRRPLERQPLVRLRYAVGRWLSQSRQCRG